MAEKDLGHFEHSRRIADMGRTETVQRPFKVTFLGAGSGFLGTLFCDILLVPGADSGELALVDIDKERLDIAEKFCQRIVRDFNKNWKITATTDRLKVLAGSDYIINCIEVSGTKCVRFDNDIPMKYGVDQCIGDTIGPGGLFKALRTVPVWLDVLRDVENLCPNAYVLNYTNPMSIMCLAAARASKAKVVGLCHSVQGSSRALGLWTGIPYTELTWQCAGVNHLAWFTTFEHKGKDMYPMFKEKVRTDAQFYESEPTRFDMMLQFGYFATETSGHDSEYLPYYRKRPELIKKYCRDGYRGGSSFYADNWPGWRVAQDEQRKKQVAQAEPLTHKRTIEYASNIIEAIETNTPTVIYGNVPNTHLIDNLPQTGVVEVACLVDRRGIQPTHYGSLPPQCAALCASNMGMFDLAAKACIKRSKEAAVHSLMLDPLTSAVCSTEEIRNMTLELFEAEKDYLVKFD